MKQVIFLMLMMAFCFGCHESNSVEPIMDNLTQLNRSNDLEGTMSVPQDDEAKEVPFIYSYDFNPDMGKGKWLRKPKIVNEGPQRYIRNGMMRAKAEIFIDDKPRDALLVMAVNRVENINSAGKTFSGTTWGTFIIYSAKAYSTYPIFEGEYTGNILGKNTEITLSGKGKETYSGSTILAKEKWNCKNVNGMLHCWTSNAHGTVMKEEIAY